MLTRDQASIIVRNSILKTMEQSGSKTMEQSGSSLDYQISENQDLRHLGIDSNESLRSLVITIAADPGSGVPSFEHYIDPNTLADFGPQSTVEDLTELVAKLAAGKLCSNPSTPHPQEYPYPDECPECCYPVL
jgi:hypothetical protein